MKSNFAGVHEVGQFKVDSGSVEVIDPCYSPGSGVIVDNVKNGEYVAFTYIVDKGDWGGRNGELYAVNKQYLVSNEINKDMVADLDWEPQAEYFGVDSGQGGIFDKQLYPGSQDEDFYDKCCNMTLNGLGAGSLEFGAVSSSGYGDGGYDFELLYEGSSVVGVKLIFIGQYDDEDE